jgi:hypothetical protein
VQPPSRGRGSRRGACCQRRASHLTWGCCCCRACCGTRGCCCRRQEAAERWGRAAAESVEGREGLRLRRLDVLRLRDHNQDETSRATTNTLADLAIAAAATSLSGAWTTSKEWECGRSEEEKKGVERVYVKNVGGGGERPMLASGKLRHCLPPRGHLTYMNE